MTAPTRASRLRIAAIATGITIGAVVIIAVAGLAAYVWAAVSTVLFLLQAMGGGVL